MVIGDHGGEIMTGTDCLQMRDLREEVNKYFTCGWMNRQKDRLTASHPASQPHRQTDRQTN
jgi:hypothetical protein